MKTSINGGHHNILTQLLHNTSSWVGHYVNDPANREAGQLFRSPDEGEISSIEIFSELVQQPGDMELRFCAFDDTNQQWGRVLTSTRLKVNKGDNARWLGFHLDPVHLKKGQNYGFILRSDNAFIAIGERVWTSNDQHDCGKEWTGHHYGTEGNFYEHFSLAYKIDFVN